MFTKSESQPMFTKGEIAARAAKGKRVLIVEDDEDIANSIRYNLERESGFDVRVAPTGEDGLKEILREAPALVLLDISLPLMSGFELCRRLRRDAETSKIPIIVLTAR